jgi:hypothetical protein
MRRRQHAARKEELLQFQMTRSDPRRDGISRLLGNFKGDRPLGFLCMTIAREATRLPWTTS